MNKTLSIKDGELYNYRGDKIIDRNGHGIMPPVGTIVAIHPDANIISLIDLSHWAFCDGTNGTPDLTNDIFLVGNNIDVNGGSNDGHYHDVTTNNKSTFNVPSISDSSVKNDVSNFLKNHTHSKTDTKTSTNSGHKSGGKATMAGSLANRNHVLPDDVSHIHPFTILGNTVGGVINGSDSLTNMPNYYKVLYYMRIL